MQRSAFVGFLTLVTFLALYLSSGPARSAEDGEVILNGHSYWRCAYLFGNERVSPDLLKKGPSKWVSKAMLAKTKKGLLRSAGHLRSKHRFRGFDPKQWYNHVYVATTSKSQYSHNHGLTHEKLPPPEGWTEPDFDDLDWPRVRAPHLMGTPPLVGGYFTGLSQLDIGRACFRAFFEVTDPGKGAPALSLTYRGGVRVFLNGTEIVRKHVPQGELDSRTTAVGYPAEAYVMLEGEGAPYRTYYRKKKDDALFCADLYGPFKMPGKPKRYRQQLHPYSEAAWNRVQQLRDRKIERLSLPGRLLKKGANCLAIEVFRSDLHPVVLNGRGSWGTGGHADTNIGWSHACLPRVELRAPKGAALSSMKKPPGVRVWAEDIHAELYPFDFLERGAPAGELHALGPKNGAAAALLVVGTDKNLGGLTIHISGLKNKGGQVLDASSLRLFSLKQQFLKQAGGSRSFSTARGFVLRNRYLTELPFLKKYQHQRAYALFYARNKLSYLDQLRPGVLGQVKKDTIQPYWIGVQIPKDAKPGEYKGTVTVEGQGLARTALPLTVEVMDWALPDPSGFQTVVGIEQNPYGVAKKYQVKLWSDEHFRLIKASMKQLARAGDEWLNIPCVRKTQYGNRDDQMIRWTRKKNGSLSFDFSILDRYLDLALKHWNTLSVINFIVVPGNQWDISVNVVDEASGKTEIVQLCDPKTGLIEKRKADWKAFATAVRDHMQARKLVASMYWGYRWDYGGYANLPAFLAETVPDIFWARAPHHFGILDKYDKISTCQYGGGCDVDLLKYGWKRKAFYLFNGSCRVNPISDNNPPHVYRTFVDTGLNWGLRGIAQVGGDHWGTFGDGFKHGVGRYAGFSCQNLLYPGKNGADSSVRYEALLQGLQEAEARIVIEQAIDSDATPAALKNELKQALISYANEKAFSFGYHRYMKENYGWRARVRIIYSAAAKAAK